MSKIHDGMMFYFSENENENGIVGFYLDRDNCLQTIHKKSLYGYHVKRWIKEYKEQLCLK